MRSRQNSTPAMTAEREIDALLHRLEEFTDACVDFNDLLAQAVHAATPVHKKMLASLGGEASVANSFEEAMRQPCVQSSNLICEAIRQARSFLVLARALARQYQV